MNDDHFEIRDDLASEALHRFVLSEALKNDDNHELEDNQKNA